MHIHQFADQCTFSEVAGGGTLPATEEYRSCMKKLHPTQVLNTQIIIPMYRVRYRYMTQRGNLRKGTKFFFAVAGDHPDMDFEIEMKLEDWVDEIKRNAPFRSISNVKILDIDLIAYAELSL